MYTKINGLMLLILVTVCGLACEKNEPEYILKPAVGDTTVTHFDLMRDQPKYMRVRKSQYERKRAIEERKKLREKARGLYASESRWDP